MAAPTETAEQVITVDPDPGDGTLQDSLHVVSDGKLVFAMDAAGEIVVGKSPSREVGYDEATVPIAITGGNFGQANVLIQCQEYVFDGKPVICEVFLPSVTLGNGIAPLASFALFEGDASLGILGEIAVNGLGLTAFWRLIPNAGTHTFSLRGWVAPRQGGPQVICGPGGTGSKSYLPAFIRFRHS